MITGSAEGFMDGRKQSRATGSEEKTRLRLAFFQRATRIAVLQTVVRDQSREKMVRANSKRRKRC